MRLNGAYVRLEGATGGTISMVPTEGVEPTHPHGY